MKIRKRMGALLLCFLMTVMMGVTAFAAEKPNVEEKCTLRVVYEYDGTAIPDAEFRLYRVASMDEDLRFTLEPAFAVYPIQTEGLDQAGWQSLANTLEGYVYRDGIEAVDSGNTDTDGVWVSEKEFDAGLYLLIGSVVTMDGYVYTSKSSIFVMPTQNTDGSWSSACVVEPKADRVPETATLKRRVLKIWNDEGMENQRPESITVQLLRNGTEVSTAVLSAGNNWRSEWTELNPAYTWTVVEKDVPKGYSVKTEQQGITYTITNTAEPCEIDPPVKKIITGDVPEVNATFRFVMEAASNTAGFATKDMPMPEGSENGRKIKDIEGAQEFEFGIIRFLREGVYTYRVYEENTGSAGYTYDKTRFMVTVTVTEENGRLRADWQITVDDAEAGEMLFNNVYKKTATPPTDPDKPKPEPLPHTGQLWWPVPILLLMGLFMLTVGVIQRRGMRNEG